MVSLVSRPRSSRELPEEVVRLVEQEIALGRSLRAIEVATGLNHSTVEKIAAGEHPTQLLGSRYHRCSRGHLTIMPCRTCAAIDAIQHRKRKSA